MLATKEFVSPTPPELLDYEFPLGREEEPTSGRAFPSSPPPPPRSLTPQVFAFPSSRQLTSLSSNSGFSSFRGRQKSMNAVLKRSDTQRSISPGSRGSRGPRPSMSPSRLSGAGSYLTSFQKAMHHGPQQQQDLFVSKAMQIASLQEGQRGGGSVEGMTTEEEGEESMRPTGEIGALSNPSSTSTPPRSPHPLASYTEADAQLQGASDKHAAMPKVTRAAEAEAKEQSTTLPNAALSPTSGLTTSEITEGIEVNGLQPERLPADQGTTTGTPNQKGSVPSVKALGSTTAAQPSKMPQEAIVGAQTRRENELLPQPPTHDAAPPNGTIRNKLQPQSSFHEAAPNGTSSSKGTAPALLSTLPKAASAAQGPSQGPPSLGTPSFRPITLTNLLNPPPPRAHSSPEPSNCETAGARTLGDHGARILESGTGAKSLGQPAASLPEGCASPLSHSSEHSPDRPARSAGTLPLCTQQSSSPSSPGHSTAGTPLQPSSKPSLPVPLPLTTYARKPPSLTAFPAPPQPPAQYSIPQYPPTTPTTLPSCTQRQLSPSSSGRSTYSGLCSKDTPGHRHPQPWPPSPPTLQTLQALPPPRTSLPYLSIDSTSSTTPRNAPPSTQTLSPTSPVHKRKSRLHRALTSEALSSTAEKSHFHRAITSDLSAAQDTPPDLLLRRSIPNLILSNPPEATAGTSLLPYPSPLKPLPENAHSAQDLVAVQQQQQQQVQHHQVQQQQQIQQGKMQQQQQQQQEQHMPSLFMSLKQPTPGLALGSQSPPTSLPQPSSLAALPQPSNSHALPQRSHSQKALMQPCPPSTLPQPSQGHASPQRSHRHALLQPSSPATIPQSSQGHALPQHSQGHALLQPCSPGALPQPSQGLPAFKQTPVCPPLVKTSQATRKQATLMPTYSITHPALRRSKTQS